MIAALQSRNFSGWPYDSGSHRQSRYLGRELYDSGYLQGFFSRFVARVVTLVLHDSGREGDPTRNDIATGANPFRACSPEIDPGGRHGSAVELSEDDRP